MRAAIVTAMLVASIGASAAPDETIGFPTEYRAWAHVKSVLVGPESPAFKTEAGIHHIYANPKAVEGYRARRFSDGSVIVYDLLDTQVTNGNTIEAQQKRVDVMVKDSVRYASTGGWGFARFFGGRGTPSVLSAEQQASCFACHSKRTDNDAVFSEFRK